MNTKARILSVFSGLVLVGCAPQLTSMPGAQFPGMGGPGYQGLPGSPGFPSTPGGGLRSDQYTCSSSTWSQSVTLRSGAYEGTRKVTCLVFRSNPSPALWDGYEKSLLNEAEASSVEPIIDEAGGNSLDRAMKGSKFKTVRNVNTSKGVMKMSQSSAVTTDGRTTLKLQSSSSEIEGAGDLGRVDGIKESLSVSYDSNLEGVRYTLKATVRVSPPAYLSSGFAAGWAQPIIVEQFDLIHARQFQKFSAALLAK